MATATTKVAIGSIAACLISKIQRPAPLNKNIIKRVNDISLYFFAFVFDIGLLGCWIGAYFSITIAEKRLEKSNVIHMAALECEIAW